MARTQSMGRLSRHPDQALMNGHVGRIGMHRISGQHNFESMASINCSGPTRAPLVKIFGNRAKSFADVRIMPAGQSGYPTIGISCAAPLNLGKVELKDPGRMYVKKEAATEVAA
jgi:hypothetical protein